MKLCYSEKVIKSKTWSSQIKQHLLCHLSKSTTHFKTEPKAARGSDREPIMYVVLANFQNVHKSYIVILQDLSIDSCTKVYQFN